MDKCSRRQDGHVGDVDVIVGVIEEGKGQNRQRTSSKTKRLY